MALLSSGRGCCGGAVSVAQARAVAPGRVVPGAGVSDPCPISGAARILVRSVCPIDEANCCAANCCAGTGARPVDLPKSASDPCPINGRPGILVRSVSNKRASCCARAGRGVAQRASGPRCCSARERARGVLLRVVLLGARCCVGRGGVTRAAVLRDGDRNGLAGRGGAPGARGIGGPRRWSASCCSAGCCSRPAAAVLRERAASAGRGVAWVRELLLGTRAVARARCCARGGSGERAASAGRGVARVRELLLDVGCCSRPAVAVAGRGVARVRELLLGTRAVARARPRRRCSRPAVAVAGRGVARVREVRELLLGTRAVARARPRGSATSDRR